LDLFFSLSNILSPQIYFSQCCDIKIGRVLYEKVSDKISRINNRKMNSPKFSQIFGPKTANFVEKKHCISYVYNNCRPPVADQYPAHRHKSISTGAQYITLDNKMKCLNVAVFFWQPHECNWDCIFVGTTNSKPPAPISMIDQSEKLSRSHVQFITLCFGGPQLCCAFYQPRQAARIWCRKTNFLI
jgi:hypothetical protein